LSWPPRANASFAIPRMIVPKIVVISWLMAGLEIGEMIFIWKCEATRENQVWKKGLNFLHSRFLNQKASLWDVLRSQGSLNQSKTTAGIAERNQEYTRHTCITRRKSMIMVWMYGIGHNIIFKFTKCERVAVNIFS
jgi:hypothetical protein